MYDYSQGNRTALSYYKKMKFEDFVVLFGTISSQLEPNNTTGCLMFTGNEKNGYGRIRKIFDGKKKDFYAHRVAKIFDMGDHNIGGDCSHICHTKLCCNPHHISVESKLTNNQRKNCVSEKRCLGHRDDRTGLSLPDCILLN